MAQQTSNDSKSKSALAILHKDTGGSAKESFYKTLAQAGIGYVGGGLGAILLGKASFLTGLAAAFYGNYKNSTWIAPLGIGMMASSHLIPNTTPSSGSGFNIKDEINNRVENVKALKDSFLSKTFLDKVLPSSGGKTSHRSANTEPDDGTSGFGNTQEHLDTLQQIDQQLVSSAIAFEKQRSGGTSGVEEEMQGNFDETDVSGF